MTAAFDWGDGSALDTVPVPPDPAESPVSTHTYAATGDYTITVTAGEQSATTEVSVTVTEEYDAGAHTIAEVQEYVTANPDTAQHMRDAEAAGKNRSTLLTWLDGVISG